MSRTRSAARRSAPREQAPVLADGHGAADDDLADLAGSEAVAVLVDDGHLKERAAGAADAVEPLGPLGGLLGEQAGGDGALFGRSEPVGPDRSQELGGPFLELGGAEEDHHAPQAVLEAAPPFDRVEHGGEQRAGHEDAGGLVLGDRVEQLVGVERLVVQQHRPGAAQQVRVEGLEAAGPLDGVEVEVDVVGADGRDAGAEGVEVVQVVVDDGGPGAVGLDPGLGVAGGPGGELEEAGCVLVDVQVGVVGVAGGLEVGEGLGPSGGVGADGDEVPDGGELGAGVLDLVGESGVEHHGRRLDVVQRGDVGVHGEVAVEHGADQVVLLEAEPGGDDLGGVVREHAHPVSPLDAEVVEGRPDLVGGLVELGEAHRAGRRGERGAGAEPRRRRPDQCTRFDPHVASHAAW
ncbi:MAG TPA: hypothetical protein VND02_05055 [Actinomycetota bacterium]|nr:hypothetical protein [Actinomycetota bacterium]